MIELSGYLEKRTGNLLAFFATLFGTVTAVMVFPDDPSPQGALVLPAALLSTGLLLIPILRAVFGLKATLLPENFLAFGITYWLLLDLIQGAYPLYGVSPGGARDAMVMVGVFSMAMWIGTFGRPWQLPNFITAASQRPLEVSLTWKLILMSFVLGMAPYVLAVNFDVVQMFSYLGEDRWSAPWARGQLGGWDAFLDQLQYFGYLLPSLVVFLGVRRGWLRLEVWIATILALIVLLFLSQGGGRRIVGVTIGAAIICWLMTRPVLRFRTLAGVVGAAAILLYIMQLMLEIRSQGYETFAQYGRRYEYLHVDDNIYRLGQVIDIIPAELPYVYFQQIFFVLVRPIPRVFWEGKPVDAGFDLPSVLGSEGASLSTSIIGEWYLVYGVLAVIFGGWFHGRLAAAVGGLVADAKSALTNPVVYSISVMVLVAGLRSMQDLVVMSYAVLAWYAVTWLIPKKAIFIGRSG